jgi:cytochrome c-type biogenesis protein CcmH/NrfG
MNVLLILIGLAALPIEPQEADVLEALGLAEKGQNIAAISKLETLKTKLPSEKRIHKALGRAYLAESLFEKALWEYGDLIRLDPNDPEANRGRAEALLGLGDGRAAIRSAKMATTLEPENAAAWHLLGEVYLHESNQDYPRAEEAFRKELEADPESVKGSLGVAKALSYQKKVNEAVSELKKVALRQPDNLIVKIKLAESYYVLRKLGDAEDMLDQVLAKDPSRADALMILEQVRGRKSYHFWVLFWAAVLIPAFYFGVRWMKKGRTPKV